MPNIIGIKKLSNLWIIIAQKARSQFGSIQWQYSRSPAVGSRHYPLWVDQCPSTVVTPVFILKGCLIFNGIRQNLLAPNNPG